jgi:hypothetical protein
VLDVAGRAQALVSPMFLVKNIIGRNNGLARVQAGTW